MKKIITIAYLTFLSLPLFSQKENIIIAGPMIGHVEFRTAKVWIELNKDINNVELFYWEENKTNKQKATFSKQLNKISNIGIFDLIQLEPGTKYKYSILYKNKAIDSGTVKTQTLWQYRTEPPAFSMLAESCAYFNEPIYDRPGKPYGNDSSIFKSMAKENADLMFWLGDNWYTREVDYYSEWGLNYRAQRDRSQQVLQPLLKAMPNYAVWDDHDYGYNNAGLSYPLKETSRSVFTSYWANPSYGEAGEGIYSRFIWNDVEFFVLDDRYFRSDDKLPDSINGQPNSAKKMFGDKQLNWLENALSQSSENYKINFRFIVSGSQMLNELNPYDCLTHYPIEYYELINFITKNKIEGVVFLTGDRHHSEIIKKERAGTYPLLDITASPLTSGLSKFTGKEKNHPSRIIGIDHTTNYGKISFSGTFKDRKMKIEFIGPGGESLTVYEIDAKDLK